MEGLGLRLGLWEASMESQDGRFLMQLPLGWVPYGERVAAAAAAMGGGWEQGRGRDRGRGRG